MSSAGSRRRGKRQCQRHSSLEKLADPGKKRIVRPGEDLQADAVDILLNGRRDNLLRGLVRAGVDNLKARIPKSPRHNLCPSVMPVQSGLAYSIRNFLSAIPVILPLIVQIKPIDLQPSTLFAQSHHFSIPRRAGTPAL